MIVVVNLDEVVNWIHVCECGRQQCREGLMADEDVTAGKNAASKDTRVIWCVQERKDGKDRRTPSRWQRLAD